MKTPSLALIPSAYSSEKVYSVLPSNGDGDFTFTREGASGQPNSTRVNKDGLIEEVNSNMPRLDYTDGSCPSLLLENQSTNLLPYSEDFSGWQNIFSTDSFGSISPSGDTSATTVTDDGNGGVSGNIIIQKNGVAVSASTKYTFSCFLKPNPNNIIEFKTANDNISVGGNWDLSTQVFTPYNSETGSVELISNNWYRASITWTTGTDTSIALRVGFPHVLRDGSNSFDIWGAQLEESSITSSYIPTDTAIATRLMDQASNDFSSQPTVANTSTLVLKFIPMGFDNDFYDLLRFSNGTNFLRMEGYLTDRYNVFGNGLTSSGMIDGVFQLDAGSVNTISFSYSGTSLIFSHNGSTIATTTPTGNLPTITEILHTAGGLSSPIKILKLEVYNDFKTQEELNSLTNSN